MMVEEFAGLELKKQGKHLSESMGTWAQTRKCYLPAVVKPHENAGNFIFASTHEYRYHDPEHVKFLSC